MTDDTEAQARAIVKARDDAAARHIGEIIRREMEEPRPLPVVVMPEEWSMPLPSQFPLVLPITDDSFAIVGPFVEVPKYAGVYAGAYPATEASAEDWGEVDVLTPASTNDAPAPREPSAAPPSPRPPTALPANDVSRPASLATPRPT
jgi:hypothetical protein